MKIFSIIVFFVCVKTYSQEAKYSKLKGDPIKASFLKEISNQLMFNYVKNTYTDAKLDNNLLDINKLITVNNEIEIIPIFRYVFFTDNIKYSIYKYSLKSRDNVLSIKTSLLYFKNEEWLIKKEPKEVSKVVFELFSLMKSSFYELLNKDKSKIPDKILFVINKAYNPEGLIDIFKLLKIIKNNKEKLKEYIE
ncbi:hypothetical protein DS884_04065 [Tenacibaculum sp. E3R01]|uniref:hypothetical protein n=1 Tax=Tenacibaculum sp. E3R01 TaxID=2267227 RepID=UPI000DE90DDC|nr:hypothetical protein [Tenacibaculum sp. E3R01]RBW60761.1 hypothetical protein DS884_04065 [Tenacibaculum sp. E3R01]